MVQWLRLCAFNAGIAGSISGWGTKIPYAVWPEREKKKSRNTVFGNGIIKPPL